MADEATTDSGSPLPPKLDLRKSGILKSPAVPVTPTVSAPPVAAAAPVTPPPAVVAPATAPIFTPAPSPAPVVTPAPAAPVAAAAPASAAPAVAPSTQSATGIPASVPRPGGVPQRPASAIGGSGAPRAPIPGSRPAWKPLTASARPVGAGAKPAVATGAPKPAGATQPVVEASAAVSKPVGKKETSRIPLEAAKPRVEKAIPAAAGMEPPSTVKISKPGETVQITGLPKPDDVAAAEKRKTSRISLDAVLGDATTPDVQAGTKTIRLKRPGEAPAAKVGGGAEGEAAEPTTTQRKTVVVKRAQDSTGGRKVSVSRAGGAGPAAAGAAGDQATAPAGQPHWAFGVVAIAAALLLCVVIYMFAAQAIGPNSCWTQYSKWPTGPNLAWPGKLAFN